MALRHARLSRPRGCREARFRHDHPRVPAPTGAPQDPPARRPPSWPRDRRPLAAAVKLGQPGGRDAGTGGRVTGIGGRVPSEPVAGSTGIGGRVPSEPVAGSPESVAGCRRNRWPGHRNRWPGAVGTGGRVRSERVAGSRRNTHPTRRPPYLSRIRPSDSAPGSIPGAPIKKTRREPCHFLLCDLTNLSRGGSLHSRV
jgi:hypothetical protein